VEHLQALQTAGLIKREERPGKKWIFYSLTNEGNEIISAGPEKRIPVVIHRFLSLVFAIIVLVFVASIGVILTEYVFHLPMLILPMVSDLAYFVFVGLSVFGIVLLYLKKVPRRGIYVGLIVGILVIPYAQFVFGYMDFLLRTRQWLKVCM
jgi:hypothetical protein